jgi:hypothetical protein
MRSPWSNGGCQRRKKEGKKERERKGGTERGKTELSSILSIENDITISLSYEQMIKEYAAKKCRKELIIEVCQAVN